MNLSEAARIFNKVSNNLIGEEAHSLAYPQIRIDLYKDVHPTERTRKSAVLMLFYDFEGDVHFCLIKRPEYDGPHSSQIAFPGGKFEKYDGDLRTTALREAVEEIGIDAGNVEIEGELSEIYIPVSDFLVKPYLAIYKGNPTFNPSSSEVDYIIHAKLDDFLKTPLTVNQVLAQKHPIPAPSFIVKEEKVWGATAMILSEFREIFTKLNT